MSDVTHSGQTWNIASTSGSLQRRAAVSCSNVVSFEEMCGVECIQPKTPGQLRVLRDVQMVATQTDFPTCDCH